MTTQRLLAQAAIAALALTLPAGFAFAGDECGSCTAGSDLQQIAVIQDDDAAQSGMSADEMLADVEKKMAAIAPPEYDAERINTDEEYRNEIIAKFAAANKERMAIAQTFVDAFPQDERSAQMMYQIADTLTDDPEARKAMLNKLVELHPESRVAGYAKGTLKQIEGVGKPFELTFEEVRSGDEINLLSDLKGKVVVIDFWATWCGPCIAEMPKMKELYSQYKDQGVEFVGVSLDQAPSAGGREKLLNYIAENDIAWPQYYQGNYWDSEFSKGWGINSIPAIFIVDADGNLHTTEARGKLETLIPELIAKRDGAAQDAEATGEAAKMD